MSDDKYNGWANWETWNVNLWMFNDEYLYDTIKSGSNYTPSDAMICVKALMPNGTPDMDNTDGGYDAVDWDEIADSFNE